MAGPNEAKLDKAASAQPVVLMQAADTWTKAADGLGEVAARLETARSVDRGVLDRGRRRGGDRRVQRPEQQRHHQPGADGDGRAGPSTPRPPA